MKRAAGAATNSAPPQPVPARTAASVALSSDELADDTLAAWCQGYLAGWDRAWQDGYHAAQRAHAAAECVALARALSSGTSDDYRQALHVHSRIVDQVTRRRAADTPARRPGDYVGRVA